MFHIDNFFLLVNDIISCPTFMLAVFLTALSIKLYILINLIRANTSNFNSKLPYFLLIGVLITTLIQDADWIITLCRTIFLNGTELRFFVLWRRLSWAAYVLQYQFITLFIESILEKNFKFNIRHKICCFFSFSTVLFFISVAILNFDCLRTSDKPTIELMLEKLVTLYMCFPIMALSLIKIFLKLRSQNLPRLLQKQLNLILTWVILPFWFFDIMQVIPFVMSETLVFINTSYGFVSIATALLTIAIGYCARRMLGLRFLNFSNHVQSSVDINFMEDFKTTLEQFSHVTNMHELNHITQNFFKEAFGITLNRTHLFVRQINMYESQKIKLDRDSIYTIIETFLNTHKTTMCEFIKRSKLLVYDELTFSNFYESTPDRADALQFLEATQADIFLPVYSRDTLIAYIIVDRHARFNEFYSSIEYDQMLIFSSYLANIINLMQNKNLDTLIQQEKLLQEELYSKHQEINQYKESIRSFLRSNKHKEIGIIFYKNRRFTFGNQAAQELVKINPNVQEGHPLTKALKKLALHVESYKTSHTIFAHESDGTKLVLSGVPSLEHNNIIISVYYPEVSDVIKKQIDNLKDPSSWDYLLYLETTKPGKLINQLIPGSGETLLSFKIELLKTALSKKATLLCNMPDEDLNQMVEIIHHISLRETLHVIALESASRNFDIAIKLFGINAIYGMKTDNSQPLLEKLDGTGTLFIKNVHLLDMETQDALAEFIRYGFFRIFKSDQKIPSNVRIICSTNQNLSVLVREEKFSANLFNELKQTTLEMPSLITLPENELNTLAEGFSEQAIVDPTFKTLLALSDKDKYKIAHQRPESLQELKTKVQQILIQKSKKNQVYHETQFDPAYDVSDPELIDAARLGKYALKDQKTMTLLWNKFKNQNKIAAFLGVNRSSINRRCKMYRLDEQ